MDRVPTMIEWRRLNAEGKLNDTQKLFFAPHKPVEELYDTQADPWEVHNLADDPQCQLRLKTLRDELTRWMKDTHDLGTIPEPQLQEQMRPGGKWKTTAAPTIDLDPAGGIRITCATPGASIAWTDEFGENAHWKLYTGKLFPTATSIRAKACRLGYKDSSETLAVASGSGK
jgi:hypothetical protein